MPRAWQKLAVARLMLEAAPVISAVHQSGRRTFSIPCSGGIEEVFIIRNEEGKQLWVGELYECCMGSGQGMCNKQKERKGEKGKRLA